MKNSEEAKFPSEAKSKKYQRERNLLFALGLAIHLAGLCLVILTGWTFSFKSWALHLHPHPAAVIFFYFLAISLYFLLLEFPFEIYSGYIKEKRYDLTSQSFGGWLWEETKKSLLSFVFFLVLIAHSPPPPFWLASCFASFSFLRSSLRASRSSLVSSQ